MSDQDKIAAILAAIQTDSNVLILMRAMITDSLSTLPSDRLDIIIQLLGLS